MKFFINSMEDYYMPRLILEAEKIVSSEEVHKISILGNI